MIGTAALVAAGAALQRAAVPLMLAAAVAAGWWLGAGRVQARWDAAELQRERAAQTLLAQDRRRQAGAADQYEAQRQQIRLAATQALPEVRNALSAPISCPAGASAPLALADVPVPAAVLDQLRHAGADPRAD